jgi:hypothetical protein
LAIYKTFKSYLFGVCVCVCVYIYVCVCVCVCVIIMLKSISTIIRWPKKL